MREGEGRRERRIVDLERIGRDDLEPARIERRDVGKRRQAALVLLDGDDAAGAFDAASARVRPPGPGPISTMVTPSSGPAARAMRRSD